MATLQSQAHENQQPMWFDNGKTKEKSRDNPTQIDEKRQDHEEI